MEAYAMPNLTMPSNLRAALKTDHTMLGVGVSFPSVEVAKKVALTGYEWAFLDAEHAPFTPMLLADMIHNISFHSQGKMIPVVRVPSHEPSFIGVALDAGAAGIVLPHSETKEQAQYLVNQCKFAPQGKRSYPPWSWIPGINSAVPDGQTIWGMSNEHIACIAQIESKLGVENAEDIIGLEGIDAVMIGIGDLRLDMGLPLDWFAKEPEFLAAVEKIESLARKYNKPVMGFAFPEMTEIWEDRIRKGYKMLVCAGDSYAMVYGLAQGGAGARESVAKIKATMSKEKEEAESKTISNGHANGYTEKVANGHSNGHANGNAVHTDA
ncbi:Phosphoenolpyruvate/pyruvate domain-containing protein [Serendipita vermifera]|nr:Phosphoenolpyruvate/pyruvate domain-containing protein [Serendipita vermifera]